MKEKMTLHRLFGLAPSLTTHDAPIVLHIINALEAKIDELDAWNDTLTTVYPRQIDVLTEAQIAVMRRNVEDMNLSIYVANFLRTAKIAYIWQLVEKTEKEMLIIRHMEPVGFRLIKELLTRYGVGLRLGMIFDRTFFTDPPATEE